MAEEKTEKPIPDKVVKRPSGTPFDLTNDPVWKKGVAKRIDFRGPEKQYKENKHG